jgi:hypothetical protein
VPPFELRLVKALAVLQGWTPSPITVPDIDTFSAGDFQEIVHAASLIEGRTVVGTWNAKSSSLNPDFVVDPDATYQLAVTMPFGLTIGSQQLDLGAVEDLLLSVKLSPGDDGSVVASPGLQYTAHRRFLPGVPAPKRPYSIRARRPTDT